MPEEKKILITVETGDYKWTKQVAKELNLTLKDFVQGMFKHYRQDDFDKVKDNLLKTAAAKELQEVEKERQELDAKVKALKERIRA